jgi:hypothetical protein
MSTSELEYRTGTCDTHGSVEGTRELPKLRFPFVVYAVLRALAKRRPYRCPTCGSPLHTA